MNDDEPGRWVAMCPQHKKPRREWEFPFFGVIQHGNFYHWGGPTLMSFENCKVLKDYGVMTTAEWDESGGDNRVYADFPPVQSVISEYVVGVEAWIDPEGCIYLCQTNGHEILAHRLVKHLGIRTSEESAVRDGDLLFDRGWIKTFWDKVFVMSDYTQRQLDILFDLLVSFEKREIFQSLCDSIREILAPERKLVNEDAEDEIEEFEEVEKDDREPERFVLTDQPFIEFTVRAYCTKRQMPDGTTRGVSCFKSFPTEVFSDEEDPHPSGESDVLIGMVAGGTGFVTLMDYRRLAQRGGDEYFVRHQDVWRAFQEALDGEFPKMRLKTPQISTK